MGSWSVVSLLLIIIVIIKLLHGDRAEKTFERILRKPV
jgi:hypothetical protein